MANRHVSTRSLLHALTATTRRSTRDLPPAFLLPAFATSRTAPFSTTPVSKARKDGNPARGISALRRSGLNKKTRLSVRLENLPKPVLDPAQRSAVEVDQDHGLWEFFNAEKEALMKPQELQQHGRGWTVAELRAKDWDDLHRLWWTCLKERNKINTFIAELARTKAGYGDYEAENRLEEIKKTQKAIKHCLTERWYAWENARVAAMEDDEINLYADPDKGEAAYIPRADSDLDTFEPAEIDNTAGRETQLPDTSLPGGRQSSELRA